MNELEKLYNVLIREGKTSKSFQEFQTQYANDNAYREKVYEVVFRDGFTKKDKETFFSVYKPSSSAQSPAAQQPAAQLPAAEEVKKKESTTALPSADGGLAQQGPKNRAPLFKPEGFDKQMPAAADATFVKKPKLDLVEKKVATAVDDRALEVEKRKAEDLFDKQTVKPRVDQSVYLKERLSNINKNLINREEEYVVPEMQYQFGDLGFKFEEAGATGDWMNVTAPNGKKTQISLDNFLDSKSQAESDRLQKFIKDNTPQKGLFVLEKTMREQDKKFNSQKQVDDEIKKINTDVTALNQKQKNFLLKKTAYENEIAELEKTPASQRNTEQFNAKLNQLEQRRAAMTEEVQSILGEEEAIKNKGKALDTSVGKYTIAKSKQGTWGGGIWDSFLGGIGKMASAAASTTIDIMTEIAPAGFGMSPQDVKNVTIEKAAKIGVAPPTANQNIEDWKKTLTPQQLDDWEDEMDDYIKKSLKKEVLPSTRVGLKTVAGDPDTTLEWENLKKQGFWGGAFLGLAESLPAMIGGSGPAGWAQRTAQMYGQVSDGLAQEMENDPEFANISENEKLAITLPIGITSAVLEAYGLKNVLASTGIINKITMSALGKAGRGVGAKSFRELVENEVQSRLLKGTLILGAAGLAEGETGALQEVSETTFKAIYNEIKGKDMFETPESALDFVENVVVAGAQEAVGGFVLGVPSAVSSAYSQKGFLKMDDNVFRTFELMANDETLQSAYIAKLKEKIANGEITVEEGKNKLNDYRNSVGLFRQLPDGLTTQQKKEAMNLLKEKRDLEQYVNGKDASLVSRQKNRINAINEELTKISEQDGGQVQSETTPEATKRRERIVELLKVLEDDNTAIEYDTSNKLPLEERNKVIEEIKTLKAEEDAVQKQATSQVPVQSGATVSEEVAQGEPQAEPQVTTQEGIQEEVDAANEKLRVLGERKVQEGKGDWRKAFNETTDPFRKASILRAIAEVSTDVNEQNEILEAAKEMPEESNIVEEIRRKQQPTEEVVSSKTPETRTVSDFATELSSKYGIEIELQENEADNSITVPKIVVPKDQRKKGIGTKAMEEVVEFADKAGKRLVLTPSTSFGGTSVKRLIDFYKSLGFVENKGKNKDFTIRDSMYRNPQVIEVTPEPVAEVEVAVPAPVVEATIAAEPLVEAEVAEEFVPISAGDITGAAFTKDNAVDYEEDFREDTKGRQYTYISSITMEVMDGDGETVGTITKLSDGDGLLSFTAEDLNGRTVAKGKEFPTLRDAKVALAEATNKIRQKEFDKQQKAVTKEKEAAKSKADKAKAREAAKKKAKEPQVEEEVVEEVQGKMDELLELDPKQKGTGQKILDGLDSMIKDIEKFEKGTLGVNIALPIMKGILQTIRALVQAGMTLQEAIKKAAKDSGTTVKQVVNGINAIGQIAPIQEAYDALMAKADALIARQKSRGIADKKIVSNLDTMIRNSDVYKNATDAQRKIMEREARVKMGVGPRKAASIGRVIGVLKDITNVSRQEKLQIISRIRELSRDVAKDLAQEIKDLAKEGKITAVQAANVVARFGNVNLLNEMSVSNFVDYMAKVFADADYDNKIKGARSKIAKARNNIATKIGIADGLMLPLQKLFSINPELIPDAQLERYLELLKMFSASDAVLTLENKVAVKKDVDAILKDIDAEQSKADELAEIFSNSKNQVFNDEGDLDYAASLKKMVKEGDITEEDAELMRKYKQDIIPQVEPTPLSDEEIAKKKEEQIADLKKAKVVTDGLPSRDENRLAKRLADLIANTSKEDLMKLSLTDLKNLLKVVNNINNGYLPHYTQIMVEKINAIKYGKILAAAIKAAKPLKFSELYSRFKAAIIRSQKGGIAEMVRRNPLYYIDQVFGDFKTKNIFEALFEQTAEAEANFKAELKKVQTILEKAEAKVAKSFNLNPDETLMSKFKMMTYMIQLEYESNKGSEQVNPAAAYLRETIKHIDGGKSRFGERDANMLQDILDEYSKDGEIDNEKLFNSFNQAEKDAISDIRKVNESLKDKAQYTAAIIRGDAIDPLNNYVHLNVLHDTEPLDVSAATDFLNQANNSRRPSTKAKSLISRTKGAKPLNFDVFASAQRGAKFVILDYNLTEPIRTARRTMNQATAELEEQGRIPKMQRDVKNAIDGAFEEAVSNLLTNSILQNSLADEAIDFISKQGYRAVLAGTGRFAAELTSNISYAILADPKAFTTGAKYKGLIMSTLAPAIMENVGSKQTNRIFPNTTLSGSFVDTSILSQATGIQGTSSKNPVLNKMQQIYNLTGKKYQNVIELTADTLISTPDKLVMRPMWFGAFANEFKKASGSEVDFDKIAANDKAYMDANQDAIQKAKRAADQKSVMTGATDNAFMGILKGTVKPNQTFSSRAFNNFNNYMTRFLIFEYVTARTAIYAMVGDGTLSKRQGAATLAAVATRMTVYTLLSQMMANGIMGLFGIGDDEEEDEKSLMQKIGQSLTGAFTSLLIGRDFGNATKLVINYGLEEINEKHLDFLREGEYDPYKDGIAYSIIPREDRPDDNLGNLLMNMTGSLGPAYNTANLIYKNRNRIVTGETEKKELDAIEREDRTVKERIPLELLGNFGLIPFYKDVKKMVNKSIYASIKEAERVAERNKRRDTDLLGGYENKTDLKRYNPELYEKNFGEGSEWYESTKEEREAKEKEAKEEQKIKDRMNNYTPEGEGGFGSAGFGKKKSSKKSSGGGFGGKKFGGD